MYHKKTNKYHIFDLGTSDGIVTPKKVVRALGVTQIEFEEYEDGFMLKPTNNVNATRVRSFGEVSGVTVPQLYMDKFLGVAFGWKIVGNLPIAYSGCPDNRDMRSQEQKRQDYLQGIEYI